MKRLAGLSVLALTLASTSGCGWLWGEEGYFRDRGSDYLTARETPPMQVPADAATRRLDPLLPVPAAITLPEGRTAFEVPRPQALGVDAQAGAFSLQTSGERRWLLAQIPPGQVWPQVRAFFDELGLPVASERPARGELISAWSVLPRGFQRHLRDEGAEASLRLRIEPGVQRNSSEIFLASNLRPAGSAQVPEWPRRSPAPALEHALLEQLLEYLNSDSGRVSSVSLLAERRFDAPSRVRLASDAEGQPLLLMVTDTDRAWSALGRALQAADIRVDDLDRSRRLYFIDLAAGSDGRPGLLARLLGRGEARSERYQLSLTPMASGVQVSLLEDAATPAPADVARRVLSLLQEKLN